MNTNEQAIIEDGGPAFPVSDTVYPNGAIQPGTYGMSLRDWFAGQALAGIMANPERWKDIAKRYEAKEMSYDDASRSNATKAYNLADAMLERRKK